MRRYTAPALSGVYREIAFGYATVWRFSAPCSFHQAWVAANKQALYREQSRLRRRWLVVRAADTGM